MIFGSIIFFLIVALSTHFLCSILIYIYKLWPLVFKVIFILYVSGALFNLCLPTRRLTWGRGPLEHDWNHFKLTYQICRLVRAKLRKSPNSGPLEPGVPEFDPRDYNSPDLDPSAFPKKVIDRLNKVSTKKFLSILWKEKHETLLWRLDYCEFNGYVSWRDLDLIDNPAAVLVFLLGFSYRLIVNLLLLPIKTFLTCMFFMLFLKDYVHLYFSTYKKEIQVPAVQDLIRNNARLEVLFRDITLKPQRNLNESEYEADQRYWEWLNDPKREWVSYTLYYYVLWHICIVPYYGAFDHLQALNFILGNKRQSQWKPRTHLTQFWVVPNTNTVALTVLFLILYLLMLPGFKLHRWVTITIYNSLYLSADFREEAELGSMFPIKLREATSYEDLLDFLRKPFYSIERDLSNAQGAKTYLNVCKKTLMKDPKNYILSITMLNESPLHALVIALQDHITIIKYTYYEELKSVMDDALDKCKKKYNDH